MQKEAVPRHEALRHKSILRASYDTQCISEDFLAAVLPDLCNFSSCAATRDTECHCDRSNRKPCSRCSCHVEQSGHWSCAYSDCRPLRLCRAHGIVRWRLPPCCASWRVQ